MLKEIIISITIIIFIFSLDFVTQNFTYNAVKETSAELSNLKEKINNGEKELNSNLKEVKASWKERRKRLAYFIEHDELEKVEVNLINMESYIDIDDLNMAIYSIDEAEYILEHIKQKNSFSLANIF